MKKTIILNQENMFELYEEKGKLFFSVVAGGIGMFEVLIELSTEEQSKYKSQGENYLIELSDDLRRNHSTEKWKGRTIPT